eukprot:GHVP01000895.1.p1 GENE.GHVP01000895.1~~GHVP01000895.1.p1  ORF type:complete len:893 (-),score=208.66 GHVP01000895.1:49-2727(-)
MTMKCTLGSCRCTFTKKMSKKEKKAKSNDDDDFFAQLAKDAEQIQEDEPKPEVMSKAAKARAKKAEKVKEAQESPPPESAAKAKPKQTADVKKKATPKKPMSAAAKAAAERMAQIQKDKEWEEEQRAILRKKEEEQERIEAEQAKKAQLEEQAKKEIEEIERRKLQKEANKKKADQKKNLREAFLEQQKQAKEATLAAFKAAQTPKNEYEEGLAEARKMTDTKESTELMTDDLKDEAEGLEDWEKDLDDESMSEEEKYDDTPQECKTPVTPTATTDEQKLPRATQFEIRSPILCVLGHVDTGKTKILDSIRRTNVQGGEAGGITQQIGATFLPTHKIQKAALIASNMAVDSTLPGLLVIDTPGHEAFINLRQRGSSLCDVAILVIDIMHGLEPQTRESIELLKMRKTPFVVAMNKVDQIYGWKSHNIKTWQAIRPCLNNQTEETRQYFNKQWDFVKLQLNEVGLNSDLYWENQDMRKTVSVCPTSAKTGDGLPDLLGLLLSLAEQYLSKNLKVDQNVFKCTAMEVKKDDENGFCVDAILTSGVLHIRDKLVFSTSSGSVDTTLRALLRPPDMAETRVKSKYNRVSEVRASVGVKLVANDLENVIVGSDIFKVDETMSLEEAKENADNILSSGVFARANLDEPGVRVMAKTLGSLEALVDFLINNDVPVRSVGIGAIKKSDVQQAGVMIERNHKEFGVILAFDVEEQDDETIAEVKKQKIRVFKREIIYNLLDDIKAYRDVCWKEFQEEKRKSAIWPCHLEVVQIFRTRSPMLLGVKVVSGNFKKGTPLVFASTKIEEKGTVHQKEVKDLKPMNPVQKIQEDGKDIDFAPKGKQVSVSFLNADSTKLGITQGSMLYSKIHRGSIEALKAAFQKEVTNEEWKLVIKLKGILDIN